MWAAGFPRCERCRLLFVLCCVVGWLYGHEGVLTSVGVALESDDSSVVDGEIDVDEGGGLFLLLRGASSFAEFDIGVA